jgi:hypothetical protein
MITKQQVAQQLAKYLNHHISLAELVNWAENSVMEGDVEPGDAKTLMQVLGRLGAADVKEFGLLWEDCEKIMHDLGYDIKVDVVRAA